MKHESPAVTNLRQARQLLIDKGWCKGNYQNAQGQHCAIGALQAVTFDLAPKERKYLRKALDSISSLSISGYNDTPNRTFSDILQLYDWAITIAQKETSYGQ